VNIGLSLSLYSTSIEADGAIERRSEGRVEGVGEVSSLRADFLRVEESVLIRTNHCQSALTSHSACTSSSTHSNSPSTKLALSSTSSSRMSSIFTEYRKGGLPELQARFENEGKSVTLRHRFPTILPSSIHLTSFFLAQTTLQGLQKDLMTYRIRTRRFAFRLCFEILILAGREEVRNVVKTRRIGATCFYRSVNVTTYLSYCDRHLLSLREDWLRFAFRFENKENANPYLNPHVPLCTSCFYSSSNSSLQPSSLDLLRFTPFDQLLVTRLNYPPSPHLTSPLLSSPLSRCITPCSLSSSSPRQRLLLSPHPPTPFPLSLAEMVLSRNNVFTIALTT